MVRSVPGCARDGVLFDRLQGRYFRPPRLRCVAHFRLGRLLGALDVVQEERHATDMVQDRRVPGMSARARACPDCDFFTENVRILYCPTHNTRLVRLSRRQTN